MYGHIVLVNTKTGFIEQAIKWFTGSQFSHSLVILPSILDNRICIEAVEGGVEIGKFDTLYKNNLNVGYQVWQVKVDQSIIEAAVNNILNDLEIGYGYTSYPWFIWRRICLLFGKDVKNQNNWFQNGIICSQLCTYYLNACKLNSVFNQYGIGSVAPQDLQNIFKANPLLFEMIEQARM